MALRLPPRQVWEMHPRDLATVTKILADMGKKAKRKGK